VETADKTKVPDVVWISPERQALVRGHASCPIAPEICIEVLLPSNPMAEMLGSAEQPGKRELYLAAGALEFWVCTEQGKMRFFNSKGEIPKSALLPEFPTSLSWFT
jgi:Uma2 family endonuclease